MILNIEWNTGGKVDYDIYVMTRKEKLGYMILAAVCIFVVGYIFYHSIIISLILCPLAYFYPKLKTREIIEERKIELNLQFKDMLYSVSSSIAAGKSIEIAFKDVIKDILIIYPDPETDIILEAEEIVKKLEMNETIENALFDFAARTHIDDIESFADVFYTCKRTGGNLIEVIRNTSNMISDKIDMKQEIYLLLAQRKFEQKIMNVIPIVLIMILSSSSWDYMEPIFTNIIGRIVMTICIGLLVISYFISKKMRDIKI